MNDFARRFRQEQEELAASKFERVYCSGMISTNTFYLCLNGCGLVVWDRDAHRQTCVLDK